MRYFVCNLSWKNRGDEAAILAMIESIYLNDSDAEIFVMNGAANKPEQVTSFFPDKKITVIEEYPSRKQFVELLIPYITKGRIIIGKKPKEFCKNIMESDIVIHGPGGPSIGEIYRLSEARVLARLRFAQRLGKKVFFYAPSAGPFESKIRNYYRKQIYKKAAGIVVREERSKYYLETLGVKNVTVAADSALQLGIDKVKFQKELETATEIRGFIGDGRDVIGLTVTDLKWHSKYKDNEKLAKTITQTFVDFVRYLEDNGYKAIFIPQKFDCSNPDYEYMKRIAEEAGTSNVMVMPDDYCSYFQQYVISRLQLVVGMRYHSNIFAYKMKTPFISIAYEHKMSGFMKIIDLENNCLPVEDIGLNAVVERFERIIGDYSNECKRLTRDYDKVVGRARVSSEKLFKILQSVEGIK